MNNAPIQILPGSLWRNRKQAEFCVLAVAEAGAVMSGLPMLSDSHVVVASDSRGRVYALPIRVWNGNYRPTGHNVKMLGLSPVVGLLPQPNVDVIGERDRQHREEKHSEQIDDSHGPHVLPGAALNYLMSAMEQLGGTATSDKPPFASAWPTMGEQAVPWDWKPKNVKRDLERAAALILAQLEKMDREERRGRLTDLPPAANNGDSHERKASGAGDSGEGVNGAAPDAGTDRRSDH